MDNSENKEGKNPADPLHVAERGLDEIDHILHQMLLLAELSASGMELDRLTLQRGFERLGKKIDCIADQLENL